MMRVIQFLSAYMFLFSSRDFKIFYSILNTPACLENLNK